MEGANGQQAEEAAFEGKTVLVGVTSSVAAYKSCEVIRGLQKAGVRAKVVMTQHATHFIDPTLFRALTRQPVAVGLFDNPQDPIHHISLAKEADVFLIAPCTANVLAKIAHGIADDILTTTALATTAPLVIAPAMNVNMYENAATQDNIALLKRRGVQFVEPATGYLACGDEGRGKLAGVDTIVAQALAALQQTDDLRGLNVLITAGPTQEPIDPVRFISNRSSGKTGYAIAQAAARRGAQVTLVSGPVSLQAPAGVQVVPVQTADQMYAAVDEAFDACDVAIFSAAVADAKPAAAADHKLKKGTDDAALSSIDLVRNKDILASMGERKGAQTVVGFAAETDDVVENAQKKLVSKHADLIVANKVGDGLAFGTEGNQVSFVTEEGVRSFPLQSKAAIADDLLDEVLRLRG